MRRRLGAIWTDGGIRGAAKTATSYVRWKAHGSPPEKQAASVSDVAIPSYTDWLTAYTDLRPSTPPANPDIGFSIIGAVAAQNPEFLRACIESVQAQTHRNWELILVASDTASQGARSVAESASGSDDRIRILVPEEDAAVAEVRNLGIAAATNEYAAFINPVDTLAPSALEWVSTCCPQADLVYTDEDKITEDGGRFDPFFKPSWSPRLLLSVNYVGGLTCVRASLLRSVGGFTPGTDGIHEHDLLLRISETDVTVAHVPFVAYHRRISKETASPGAEIETGSLEMVQRTLGRQGWNARAAGGEGVSPGYRVVLEPRLEHQSVKVVIPTRDGLNLLERAVDGVLNRTDDIDVHLVVVDNASEQPETLTYLDRLADEHPNVTILRNDDPFNFSALCNAGARTEPQTPYLLFLNNDIEVLDPRWLRQLVGWLEFDPSVAAAGPQLLFPDQTIQHGGVVLGFRGIAGHYAMGESMEARPGSLQGYPREVSCLTAACLLVRSGDFDVIGGFDETLDVDFQDVDLCLRLERETGGAFIYDPTFPLVHRESATRGSDEPPGTGNVQRMRELWADRLAAEDPYYSPHLSLTLYDFSLRPIDAAAAARQLAISPRWAEPERAPGTDAS